MKGTKRNCEYTNTHRQLFSCLLFRAAAAAHTHTQIRQFSMFAHSEVKQNSLLFSFELCYVFSFDCCCCFYRCCSRSFSLIHLFLCLQYLMSCLCYFFFFVCIFFCVLFFFLFLSISYSFLFCFRSPK